MSADSETNSLTMKLLALSSYCEGPKAQEIKNVITQLPAAAYKERTAADSELARLRQENSHLKQRLALEVLANRPPSYPPPPTRGKIPHDEMRPDSSNSSSINMSRDSYPTPPRPRELFPEDRRPPLKRLREESLPAPSKRPRPMCTGCFQIGGMCDGRSECSVCKARGYGCEYNECWDGRHCRDEKCTRLHNDQWSYNEEPKRVVKLKNR